MRPHLLTAAKKKEAGAYPHCTHSPATFIHFLRHVIDIQCWCLLSESNRDLLFGTGTIVNGVVAILLIEKLSGNNSGGNSPGLHNIWKHGIHDETVEYALLMRFMINASVTLYAFIVFVLQICAAALLSPRLAELTLNCLEEWVEKYITCMFVHYNVLEVNHTSMGSFLCVCVCDMNVRYTHATASLPTHHHVAKGTVCYWDFALVDDKKSLPLVWWQKSSCLHQIGKLIYSQSQSEQMGLGVGPQAYA